MPWNALHVTSLSDFYPESSEGRTLVSSYGIITGLLEAEIGGEAASFLAEPIPDQSDNSIVWHSSFEGEKVPFAELSPEGREAALAVLRIREAEFAALSVRLLSSGSASRRHAGALISRLAESVRAFLDGNFEAMALFTVNGKPVLAGWGLKKASVGPTTEIPAALTEAENLASPSVPIASQPLSPGASPGSPDSPGSPGDQGVMPLEGPAAPWPPAPYSSASLVRKGDKRGLLYLLLAVLISFPLFLLLFFLLFPDLLPVSGTYNEAVFDELSREEDRLREELYSLRELYQGRLYACSVKGGEETYENDLKTAEGPGLPKVLSEPEGGDLAPEEPEDQTPFRVAVLDETPAAPPARSPNERLIIPEDATSLSFMEGCWVSKSELYNTERVPVVYIYCFNKSGGADVYIEEKNALGTIIDTCKGKAKATLSKKVLRVSDNGLKCRPGNGSYFPINVTCQNSAAGQSATCQVKSATKDSRSFNSLFIYLGKSFKPKV